MHKKYKEGYVEILPNNEIGEKEFFLNDKRAFDVIATEFSVVD